MNIFYLKLAVVSKSVTRPEQHFDKLVPDV